MVSTYASLPSVLRGLIRLGLRLFHMTKRILGWASIRVRVLIFNERGELLLMRQPLSPQWWLLPGGGVKRGETLQQALIREMQEEFGFTALRDVQVIGAYSDFMDARMDYLVLFRSTTHETPIRNSWEVTEVRFFPLHDLPENCAPSVLRRIQAFQQNLSDGGAW